MKLVLLITALTSISAQSQGRECANNHDAHVCEHTDCALDLSFLLDSSESIELKNHGMEKTFAVDVVEGLPSLELQSQRVLKWRVALLQYSSHVQVEYHFREWLDTQEFKDRVQNLTYLREGTKTVYAITNITKMYEQETTPRSLKIAVLLTDNDGRQQLYDDRSAVTVAKEKHNINFITVGIKVEDSIPCQLANHPYTLNCNLQDENIVKKVLEQIVELADRGCPKCQSPPTPPPTPPATPAPCECEKGEMGPKGQKGEKGPKGNSGTHGQKGWKGEIGLCGPPGPEGLTGKPGPKGVRGEWGKCGIQGIQGEMGPPGPIGPNGMKGQKGSPGPQGDIGPEGLPGEKGERGYPGPRGFKGDIGLGLPGPKGDTGLKGSDGLPGPDGFGPPGPLGPRGPKGVQGVKGPKGELGPKGAQGYPGQIGPKGDNGLPGPLGKMGPLGSPGPTGPSGVGEKGEKGDTGLKGSDGLPGPDGFGQPGPLGPQGLPGLKGEQGPEGPKGDIGFKGYKGDVGLPGEGLIGPKGQRGIQGPKGPKGTKGDLGDPGLNGGPGPVGPKGLPCTQTREDIIILIREICGCSITCEDTPMELVFVIDSSESVREEGFEKIQDFVSDVVKRFTIGPTATRIGLVLYSQRADLKFNLNSNFTKQNVIDHIEALRYIGEGTYTGNAIRTATQAFSNARDGVRKVAVVLTDGQTDPVKDPVKLEEAVREAHSSNIDMHVVGVFNSSHPKIDDFKKELRLIASDPDEEHEHYIEDFNHLSALESKLLSKICQEEPPILHNNHGRRDTLESLLVEYNVRPQGEDGGLNRRHSRRHGSSSSSLSSSSSSSLSSTSIVQPDLTPLLPEVSTPAASRCNLPSRPGPCRDYTVHWYYLKQADACAQFWYGGCGGNDNRFKTDDECRETCVLSRTAGKKQGQDTHMKRPQSELSTSVE